MHNTNLYSAVVRDPESIGQAVAALLSATRGVSSIFVHPDGAGSHVIWVRAPEEAVVGVCTLPFRCTELP